MNEAEQALHDGDLTKALGLVQDRVRVDPADAANRIFLFQLLVVLGEWERALGQLKVIADLDIKAWPMVETYREALRCEKLRQEIFLGRHQPLVFGDPEHWVALLVEALRLTAEDQYAKAGTLREQAFELAPVTPGTIDGRPFGWIADADTRIGPILEAIVNGNYYWIPFHHIKEIHLEPPEDLRDLVWLPAHFIWANEGESVGLVPSCYPGSQQSADALIRMGRKTEWQEPGDGAFLGLGQRVLATDEGEYPLLEIRDILLSPEQGGGKADG